MDHTPKFQLPHILSAQAQKHVTHNEALRRLDALSHISIISKTLSMPPDAPDEGDCYLVDDGGQGDWQGKDRMLACFQDGSWQFIEPRSGMLAWLESEAKLLAHDGGAFAYALEDGSGSPFENLALLGINSTADDFNRFALSSSSSLFTHEGNGHQLKINKNAAADTASALFQTGYSGRAELGLAGDDNFHVKVSPDGSNWHEAFVVDRTTGSVSFPNTTFATNSNTDGSLGTGTANAAGNNLEVQFNDNGSFGASGDLTFDKTSKALGVGGSLSLPATSSNDVGALKFGDNTQFHTYADNVCIGYGAGNFSMTGHHNYFVGRNTGKSCTGGTFNNFYGHSAGQAFENGSNNNFYGYDAGYSCKFVYYNSFFGKSAGRSLVSGNNNSFFGVSAGNSFTSGSSNTCIGLYAGDGIQGGSNNTIIGRADGLPAFMSNTIILADGAGNQRLTIDSAGASFDVPLKLPSFTVATTPLASNAGAGAMIFCF